MVLDHALGIISVVWLICFLVELLLIKLEKAGWKNRVGSNDKDQSGTNYLMLIPIYIGAPIVLYLHICQLIRDGGFSSPNSK